MKTRNLITSFALIWAFTLTAQNTSIIDNNFEQALINLGYDDVIDGQVVTSNISNITSLNISSSGISDLSGLEDFKVLEFLNCSKNQLTVLDLSQNKALTDLICFDNQITSLDLNHLKSLDFLSCGRNQITSLDLSQNTVLSKLLCFANRLTELDLSNNTLLTQLLCEYNQLTTLDLSKNIELIDLFCVENQLISLDVTKNIKLKLFDCSDNKLSYIDLSNKTMLTYLNCYFNQLTSLDVTQSINLDRLFCNGNNLTCIKVNQVQLAGIPENWTKDNEANYSLDCSSLSINSFNSNQVKLWPNPVKNIININGANEGSNFSIYNIIGKEVLTRKLTNKVDISMLENGVYFMRLTDKDKISIYKIIKN
jgi:hypothetical protein